MYGMLFALLYVTSVNRGASYNLEKSEEYFLEICTIGAPSLPPAHLAGLQAGT